MDRRATIAIALVVGFGIGWLVRSYVPLGGAVGEPSAGGGAEAGEPAASGDVPDGAPPGADAQAGGAAEGEAGAGGASDTERAGGGSVAVVGGGGAGGGSGAGSAAGGGEGGGSDAPGPSPDAGAPGVLGAEAIRGVVREHREQLGFCFAWQLHQHPELGGQITMEFVIDGSGHVAEARVADDTVEDETVARCFVSVTRRMEFPPPEGGGTVTVRYPFRLSAGDEPSEE